MSDESLTLQLSRWVVLLLLFDRFIGIFSGEVLASMET